MKYTEFLVNGQAPWWWHWKNFTPQEVACKKDGKVCPHCGGEIWGTQFGTIPLIWFFESMDALQALRNAYGKPLVINSGHRCKTHNKEVGGVANSKHLTNIAFDCRVPFEEQEHFAKLAHDAGFHYVLTYPDRGFVHCDIWTRH